MIPEIRRLTNQSIPEKVMQVLFTVVFGIAKSSNCDVTVSFLGNGYLVLGKGKTLQNTAIGYEIVANRTSKLAKDTFPLLTASSNSEWWLLRLYDRNNFPGIKHCFFVCATGEFYDVVATTLLDN